MARNENRKSGGLLLLALLFLANPNVHVVDILPDFIAYLIIIKKLSYAADRAPYFEEAKSGFTKLAVLSLAKLPAFFILTAVRSGNVGDNDILSLFSFSFGVIEAVLLVTTLKDLFSAFFYLGERSDADSLLSPFKISKRGRLMPVEGLKKLCYAFAIYKCAAYALPEMLLLTKTVDAGMAATVFNVARLYPYVIIFAVLSVLIFGIITDIRFNKYLIAIRTEGKFTAALDALNGGAALEELNKKLKIKNLKSVLMLFSVAPIFMLDIRVDNLYSVNLLPRVIFGLLLLYAIYKLGMTVGNSTSAIISAGAYSAISIVTWIFEFKFLTEYGLELLASSSFAKEKYIPVLILSAVELAALAASLILTARMLSVFVSKHTGVDPFSDRYMRSDAEYHSKTKTKVYIWSALGILCGASGVLNGVFKYFSKNTTVIVGEDFAAVTETVTESLIPWFPLIVLGAAILFIAYSMYLFSTLREDVELKYL